MKEKYKNMYMDINVFLEIRELSRYTYIHIYGAGFGPVCIGKWELSRDYYIGVT